MCEDLTGISAAAQARMILRREVSPVEIVEAHLRRIERVNPPLNAVVSVAPDAIEQARSAESSLMRGVRAGPLHGVPLTVKDTVDARGMPATAGSRTRAGRLPEADAPAVARLRAAGAVIIGKTNCAEMGLEYTADNPLFGRTNNPHDLSRTPGGSSGGCAAAVSAHMAAASLGSDLAGSVRIPANFCGVVGFRPACASVPRAGHCPPMEGPYTLGASLGPIARTVEDARLVFSVVSGSVGAARSEAEAHGLKGVRFSWYEEDGVTPVSDDVRAVVVRAVRALEEAGMTAVAGAPPHVEMGNELWTALFSQATRSFLGREYEGRVESAGPLARLIIERGKGTAQTLEDFIAARALRDRLREDLLRGMESAPLVVAPVGAVAAFRHGEAHRVEAAGRFVNTFAAFAYSQAFNVFDLPAVAVPAGRTREGLPAGVQIVGRPGEEELLFSAASAVERALGGYVSPPEISPQAGENPL